MKTPLHYQPTAFDCGRTTMVNAFVYLFEREEIPPQAIDFIARVTSDCNLAIGERHRGTSAHSLAFIAAWCNDYLVETGFPVHCQALAGDDVSMAEGSPLVEGLRNGAVAVCGCDIDGSHYVLVTGIDGEDVLLFDPYWEPYPPVHFKVPDEGVTWVDDHPLTHNRIVRRSIMDDPDAIAYSLYAKSGRDAVLMWRTDK